MMKPGATNHATMISRTPRCMNESNRDTAPPLAGGQTGSRSRPQVRAPLSSSARAAVDASRVDILSRRQLVASALLLGAAAAWPKADSAAEATSGPSIVGVASKKLFEPGNFWVWGYFEHASTNIRDVRAYELYCVLPQSADAKDDGKIRLGLFTLYPKNHDPANVWIKHDAVDFNYDELVGARESPYVIGTPLSVQMNYWNGKEFLPSTKNFNTSPVEEKFNFVPYIGSGDMASETVLGCYDGENVSATGSAGTNCPQGAEPVFQQNPARRKNGVFMSFYGADQVTRYKLFNPQDSSSVTAMRLVYASEGDEQRVDTRTVSDGFSQKTLQNYVDMFREQYKREEQITRT